MRSGNLTVAAVESLLVESIERIDLTSLIVEVWWNDFEVDQERVKNLIEEKELIEEFWENELSSNESKSLDDFRLSSKEAWGL